MSSPHEYVPGSVGVLLPWYQARLVREDGSEVEAYGEPGQLLLSSPNQAAGYHGDDEATAATFQDGWLYTGDVAMFRQSPNGDSHLLIVDRLKDMIKVKVCGTLFLNACSLEWEQKAGVKADMYWRTGHASLTHCN